VVAAQLVEQQLMVEMEAILFLALLHLMVVVVVAAVAELAIMEMMVALVVEVEGD
jgi:hypothetical protein